jgi:tRNA G18 (ribose-2'-O)-methylase SpoU
VPILSVDDASDHRLDEYRNVPDPELLERRGRFVAEGRLVVGRLLTGGRFVTRSVLVTQPARASIAESLAARPDVPVYVVPQAVMSSITGFNIHRGCLAIGERPPAVRWQDVAVGARTIVVLERVANADNIGGVFRNAAAFGADAILLDPSSTDPLYRKAIRTSMGAALTVPFARLEPWPDALEELRRRGYVLVAMTPSASATLHESADALRRAPIAIAFGHEGEGLTAAALEACDCRVRIPIAREVDSLNVATSAGIALYELRMI